MIRSSSTDSPSRLILNDNSSLKPESELDSPTRKTSFISNLLKLFSEKGKPGSLTSPPLSPSSLTRSTMATSSSPQHPSSPAAPSGTSHAQLQRTLSGSQSEAAIGSAPRAHLAASETPSPSGSPMQSSMTSRSLIQAAKPPLPPLPPFGHSNQSLPSPRQRAQATLNAAGATLSPGPRPPEQPPSSPTPVPRRVSRSNLMQPSPASVILCTSPSLPPKMQRASWSLSDYAIFEKMYTGYASTVHKAWCKRSGEVVCLKLYNLAQLGDLHKFQIYREVKLHSSMQHQHVIHLLGAFQQGEQVVLVQEYAEGGDLFLLLHRHGGKLAERQAVELVLQPFLLVLNYLHQQCIAHRDLKPENILFTRNNTLKLCDFGLAIDMREERAVTRAGTLEYMAPEVLNCPYKSQPQDNKEDSSLHYSTSVDAWAVGILTYELLVGLPPFSDSQRATIEDKIRNDVPKYGAGVSERARHFINTSLAKEAHLRPTVLELLHHPWIEGLRRSSSMRKAVPPVAARPLSLSTRNSSRRSLPFGVEEGDSETEEGGAMESAAASAVASHRADCGTASRPQSVFTPHRLEVSSNSTTAVPALPLINSEVAAKGAMVRKLTHTMSHASLRS